MHLEKLSEQVIGACFEVSNELGIGFVESVYEKALLIALKDRGLKAESQVPVKVFFRQHVVGEFFADIVVGDQLIIELKAVKMLAVEHIAQAALRRDLVVLDNTTNPMVYLGQFF